MQREILEELLVELCGSKPEDGEFVFSTQDIVAALLADSGPLVPIERVVRVALRSGYAILAVESGERVFLDLQRIAGFKVLRSRREGAGFRP